MLVIKKVMIHWNDIVFITLSLKCASEKPLWSLEGLVASALHLTAPSLQDSGRTTARHEHSKRVV